MSTTAIAMPVVSERVANLLKQMTLEEKVAQLVGYWLDQNGTVAPMQSEMAAGQKDGGQLNEITEHGIGHFTRVYGTRPVEPDQRAAWLWAEQRRIKRETRLGIPALVHEECLTGLAAWKAATFPTPLAWGASFNHELVEESAAAIGDSMRELGIHQGLAPVLDVARDARWGRIDECIGEDPYLVGTIGTAYVRGLQSAGVHATLKHFVGYSGSGAGRNHAPVSAGPREIADVFLPPFEMAILDGNARSVMNSYTDVDGVPMASSVELLNDLLREKWGFDGTVVADYFAVAFLEVMHGIAADRGEAAALALEAGLDIELPTGDAFLAPLIERIRSGKFDEGYVDRAVLRALSQKEELGLLNPEAFEDEPPTNIDLDSPRHQDLARRLAQDSIILLSNDGVLPLRGLQPAKAGQVQAAPGKIAVIGPNAHRADALMGCYSFANHVLVHHPGYDNGFEIPTVFEALQQVVGAERHKTELVYAQGCSAEGSDTTGFAGAIATAKEADIVIAIVGDQAGLFGRGTVGEGNDTESLELPGVQRQLVEELVATGKQVIMVALTGRPYAFDWALDGPGLKPAAVLQAFFPGEGGGPAIVDVITGVVNPSGRLPVSLPRSSGSQPYSYLHPILGGPSDVTSFDSTPLRPFGFGLSYTEFDYTDLDVSSEVATDGTISATVTVTNVGPAKGTEVVQLYGHDVQGSIARPIVQLLGYTRLTLKPGESKRITFAVPTTRFAFSDRKLVRVVEPGAVEIWVGAHAHASVAGTSTQESTGGAITNKKAAKALALPGAATPRTTVQLTGEVHAVTSADERWVHVTEETK